VDNYEDPLPGKTYISPSLASFNDPGRKVRIATKLLDQSGTYAYAQERGEVVLRHKDGAKTTIKAKFFEDDSVSEEQYRSCELLRRNTVSPEVMTFDELYERARFIFAQSEA
jgi:hypothetical protein